MIEIRSANTSILQGAMCLVHIVGFRKGDLDFIIVFHSNFDSV